MSISPSTATPFVISTICHQTSPNRQKYTCNHTCIITLSDGNSAKTLLDADSIRNLIDKRGLDNFRAVDAFGTPCIKQTTKNWMHMHFNTDICSTYWQEEAKKISAFKKTIG